jgi:hypothetical protein
MNGRLQEIVNAVLYEGYMLYPYRASSIKNQRERFTFGRVYPRWYSEGQGGVEPCVMQTECLVESEREQGTIEVTVRFLQPAWREVGVIDGELSNWENGAKNQLSFVPELKVGENVYQTWQEAIEREAKVPVLNLAMCAAEKSPLIESYPFRFGCAESREPILDERGQVAGVLVRSNDTIEGQVEVASHRVEQGLFKVTVRIKNESPSNQTESQLVDLGLAALMGTFASTHTILNSQGGAKFVSLIDPPEKWREVAAGCKNIGTWPVLVGDEESGERDTMLSSPIILYDYPKIAPESPGDLFDCTEIDEILTLRIMTMTDEEKREMRNVDAQARKLLERTEAIGSEEFLKLHGARREPQSFDEQIFGSNTRLEGIAWKGAYLKSGSRVRICPKGRADVMDLALAGRTAVIEAVEQDAEKRIHLALVLDDDPGRDLGFQRQPGHRFFFGLEEVEVLR